MNNSTPDRPTYTAYIRSPAWRRKREQYWASKMPKDCYVCGTHRVPGFHLPHRTYKNLGNERLMDLTPVCEPCHSLIHRVQRADPQRWKRAGLWAVTKWVRKNYRKAQHEYPTNKQRSASR